MLGYRKPSGVYIEVSNGTPVSGTLVPVAIRPSVNHTFSDTWQTNPLDPSVCWRLKTAAEQQAGADTELQAWLDSPTGKVVKAIALVGVEKGVWTLAEIRTKYRNL